MAATRAYRAEQERTIAASPELLWALLADTNRWDRVVGCNPSTYQYQLLDESDPSSRARVGSAKQFGSEQSWTEHGEWIESRLMWGERRFRSGPVPRAGYRVELSSAGAATSVRAEAYVAGENGPPATLGSAMQAHFETALSRYLGAVAKVATELAPAALREARVAGEPASAMVRRLLANLDQTDGVHRTAPSVVNLQELAYRISGLRKAPLDPATRERLIEFLRTRPDDEVRQMRPFELARGWGLDKKEVLRSFLHAARAGLVDLQWQLECPICRVAATVVSSLEDVGKRSRCDECDAGFALDFASNVEAVFHISAAVRKVESAIYCGGSPWFRPHVFALLNVDAHASRELDVALPAGSLLMRSLLGRGSATLADRGEPPPAVLGVRMLGHTLELSPQGHARAGAPTRLQVENAQATDASLVVERADWAADRVSGSTIVTMPDFLDLFSAEAPAAGIDLSVGAMTVMFSDLTGTTALYEQLGDARAFALVQEHFRDVGDVISRNDGAVVKTMGDAVMATFPTPGDALAASIEIIALVKQADARHDLGGLSIKIGIHHGPCLAVRANDRLDFFGTTVNIASRLQHQARANQVVILSELMSHPAIVKTVQAGAFRVEQYRAQLKGLRESQVLLSIEPIDAVVPGSDHDGAVAAAVCALSDTTARWLAL